MDREEFTFQLILINACLCRLGRELQKIHEENLQMIAILEEDLEKMKRYGKGGK